MSSGRIVYSSVGSTGGYHLGNANQKLAKKSTPEDAVPHSGISYADLQKRCLRRGELFEDPDFPAVNTSLFYSREPPVPFVWKRPQEITEDPKLFVGGATRFDITQGMLGDCWLLAAVASLCRYKNLFYQVVPHEDPGFDSEQYCGLFRFRFWQYGRWEEVVVDDRLPTYNNKLVFMHSAESTEFWSALLEKAYAKLCGSYESLKGGQTSEAMVDFTGGVNETFKLDKLPRNFFKLMLKAQARQSLMCCSINAKPNEIEAKLENGLIKGHAYTVTGVTKVTTGDNEVELVRVRNPWGNEREWTGAWSDGSDEWNALDENEKEELGLNYDDDGEFWMAFEDFKTWFSTVEICMLSPDSALGTDKKSWAMDMNLGSWQKHVSAGGCRNFIETFALNPQYRIKLEDVDDDEDEALCTIVLGLVQKNRRRQKRFGAQNLAIGFAIYKLPDDANEYMEQNRLSKDFFLYHKSEARSENFVNSREVTGRFIMEPGEYLIIPSTFSPGEEGDFLLRIFSEKAQVSGAMDTRTQIEYKPREVSEEDNQVFDEKFKTIFEDLAGTDEEIDSFELQQIMNSAFRDELGGRDFSLEAARSVILMVDRDRNGKLEYAEFRDMWQTMKGMYVTFKECDKDNNDHMNAVELRNALARLGFSLSTPVLSSLALRYANKKGFVNLDDFIQICCRVKSTFESYLSYQGKSFSLDDYIMSAVYC